LSTSAPAPHPALLTLRQICRGWVPWNLLVGTLRGKEIHPLLQEHRDLDVSLHFEFGSLAPFIFLFVPVVIGSRLGTRNLGAQLFGRVLLCFGHRNVLVDQVVGGTLDEITAALRIDNCWLV
jgi:hypothetical protein